MDEKVLLKGKNKRKVKVSREGYLKVWATIQEMIKDPEDFMFLVNVLIDPTNVEYHLKLMLMGWFDRDGLDSEVQNILFAAFTNGGFENPVPVLVLPDNSEILRQDAKLIYHRLSTLQLMYEEVFIHVIEEGSAHPNELRLMEEVHLCDMQGRIYPDVRKFISNFVEKVGDGAYVINQPFPMEK